MQVVGEVLIGADPRGLAYRLDGQVRGGLAALAQRVQHDAEHLLLGSGLAGPDLELARALLDEHLDAGDDRDALLARHADAAAFRCGL